jgi:hypothetical protein
VIAVARPDGPISRGVIAGVDENGALERVYLNGKPFSNRDH